ncbi:MAG: ornithine carbamoyltransferase [Planctomycetaceae bacterium]|nr:ornithine carbamoyltransferase [Planctomycetaceae bacterium]MCA9111948.1 ornithine carbamoyltransferase [Planctomycetaceae bacterium]
MQHLLSLRDLTPSQVQQILSRTAELKSQLKAGDRKPVLQGRVLTQVFEKPSLRTRVSFEAAIGQLGGYSIFLSGKEAGLEGRESTADVARVIGGYSDVIALRTFSQELIELFAEESGCHVINALSDASHPCQALTDIFTMQEAFGDVTGRTLTYVGDGNNVAVSLATICAQLDIHFVIAAPEGYQLKESFFDGLRKEYSSASLTQTTDPHAAVANADVIYTDVWASMGQESEKSAREKVFADYQCNAALLASAPSEARFLHCLPARRGLEVTDDVIDGPQSLAFPQAENRMHLAKGVLAWLLDV